MVNKRNFHNYNLYYINILIHGMSLTILFGLADTCSILTLAAVC